MKTLLFIDDPLLRDQLRAGFASSSEFDVVVSSFPRGLHLLGNSDGTKPGNWDWVWVQLHDSNQEATLKSIRERNKEALIVVLGEQKFWEHLTTLKEEWKIAGFLSLPMDPVEFFRTVGRLRSRYLSETQG